jgi:hypothetical protein
VNCAWITRNSDPVITGLRRSNYCYSVKDHVGENCVTSCGFCKGTFPAPSNRPSMSPSPIPSHCTDEPDWKTQ